MQKKIPMVLISIVLAVVTVFTVKYLIETEKKKVTENAKEEFKRLQSSMVAVLVANKDLPRGTVIDPSMVVAQVIPEKYVRPNAATAMDAVAGMGVIEDILKGEQITANKVTQIEGGGKQKYTQKESGLAEVTPAGKRAITISVDNISSLAGMIKPGDFVDLIAIIALPNSGPMGVKDNEKQKDKSTVPLFQNVLVLAVGDEILSPQAGMIFKSKGSDKKKDISPLITLALSPEEANLISFVNEQGKIRLVLRSPGDTQIDKTKPADWDTLLNYITPSNVEAEKPREEKGFVEIYRGLNKERMPLSNK
ncbi:MAG: Flp pilus assembly protein CpaB [Candidatus Omnitrophica bacterium]|nr:Flp pilus assembly protein CpaB [Candidatus Omnitrophota bacterium]